MYWPTLLAMIILGCMAIELLLYLIAWLMDVLSDVSDDIQRYFRLGQYKYIDPNFRRVVDCYSKRDWDSLDESDLY